MITDVKRERVAMTREEAITIMQLYKEELEHRIAKIDYDIRKIDLYSIHLDAFEVAIKALSAEVKENRPKPDYSYEADMVRRLKESLSAEAVQGWIPFTRRPITEEEQKDYPNCTFMFDCVLPNDGEEILVSNRRFVWMDTFCSDIDGCYLDGGDDIDEDMAWMPLPKPYKGGDDE